MGASETPERELTAAARLALTEGRKIDAIKLVREAHGLGLAEAKQLVEAQIERDPVMKLQYEQRVSALKSKLIRWSLVVDVIIVAGLLWWFFGRDA